MATAVEKSLGPDAPMAPGSTPRTAPRKASSALAWLALLLVTLLAVVMVWALREVRDRESALLERMAALESSTRQQQTEQAELGERLQRESRELKTAVTEETSRLAQGLASVDRVLAEQQKELARFSASDRNSWLLAEAGHLLRLANQRLVMAGDPVAAQALLESADAILRELDDASLHKVRAAVATDIAALRAAPRVDVEGIYLRLAALIEQADTLVIFQLPQPAAAPPPAPASDWQGRLRQGYAAALARLSDYVIIRRRDVPVQTLMDPQWEGLVRQNLRMLLEQAQVALLSGNQQLYVVSLERARQWVAQFLETDTVAAPAMTAQITELAGLTIGVAQPDISLSQRALDEAIALRQQQVGGGQ